MDAMTDEATLTVGLEATDRKDIARVGGKNASLGEMIGALSASGIRVPGGFATTADAYWRFVEANGLRDVMIAELADLDDGKIVLADAGKAIRTAFLRGDWPEEARSAILSAYRQLGETLGYADPAVAVRSSATAEDLPDASFAGQQETFLNVVGEDALVDACRRCFASLFTDRAIAYRRAKGFDHLRVALSVGVQQMVRADLGGAGVMFSIDTETGFDQVVLIDAAWGLGENVVQGAVDPDSYQVFKPLLDEETLRPIVEKKRGGKAKKMIFANGGGTRNVPTSIAEQAAYVLSDEEIVTLARWARLIEAHYGTPMDMEWAKDGVSGELFVVQARPETVQSRREGTALRSYRVETQSAPIVKGLAIGDAAVAGRICMIASPREIDRFEDGAILVTENTDPDWVPIMQRAAAIVTDHGGRTSHAAIVSRELGLPAVVGTGNATHLLHDQQEVTVSCAEGDEGFVYPGAAAIMVEERETGNLPATRTKLMLNLANPAAAYRWWRLPADGVGLARTEFVISNSIRIHPMALVHFDRVTDEADRREIVALTRGYAKRTDYFVDRLARGLGRIAATVYPHPVIVRTSDFKTNEYANLIGGAAFEPKEENPMLGFRGAARYYSQAYHEGFALECMALVKLRNEMGFTNVSVMIPFCRTVEEADRVLAVMAEAGLRRGDRDLEILMMCETPANVILAADFARRFDGFSVGSNDLTQLTLGVDRDSEALADLFDEENPAVRWMITAVTSEAHKVGVKVGFCGQAPGDIPGYVDFLVGAELDSISVSPDRFIDVKHQIAKAEAGL
jgi:pyruvate,water dikinase